MELSLKLTFLVAALSLDFGAFSIPGVLAVPFSTGLSVEVVVGSYKIKQNQTKEQHSLESRTESTVLPLITNSLIVFIQTKIDF